MTWGLYDSYILHKTDYYPEWITTYIKSIDIRNQHIDRWKVSGVQEGTEYCILIATIYNATFEKKQQF